MRIKKYRRIGRRYEEASREYVLRVLNHPELLGIEGLTSDTVLVRQHEPSLIDPTRTDTHTVDLVFLYKPEDYEIVVAEEKGGLRQSGKGYFQLRLACGYFSRDWGSWFEENLGDQLDTSSDFGVYISSLLFYYDVYDMAFRPIRKVIRTKLGNLSDRFSI